MAIGALVPIFWGLVSFIYFGTPNSRWTDLFWNVVYITCPSWLLPENNWSILTTPLANAVLYGLAVFLVSIAISAISKRTKRTR
jgi:hypothetical protein